jgi:phosphinothricin acetyltransferase
MTEIEVRRATIEDASQIHAIFSHYVHTSVATYYHTPPPLSLIRAKIERSVSNQCFPFFVAVHGDTVVGYAYGSEYRVVDGYNHVIEDSIFIHPDHLQKGLGRTLLGTLIEACKVQGYKRMIAVFGAGREELPGTFRLHEGFGFREVGRLLGVGEKFGRTLDTPILQLDLDAEFDESQPLTALRHT